MPPRPSPGEFIGAGNYLRALDDPNFRSSIVNAVVVLLSVPFFVTIPMLLAILIDQGVPGRTFFRSVYFFPVILSSVIIGSIFSVVLSFNGKPQRCCSRCWASPAWTGSAVPLRRCR